MSDVTTNGAASGSDVSGASGASSVSSGNGIQNPSALEAKQREILAELKKEREARRSLEARIQEAETMKLQAEGKKDEVISQLQKTLKEKEMELKKTQARYASKSVKSQVALKAKELGCLDTDLLTKALDLDTLQVNVVDDEFNVDEESLNAQLETLRKTKSFLFKQAGPKINDAIPSNSAPTTSKPDLSKMTLEEMKRYAVKAGIKA